MSGPRRPTMMPRAVSNLPLAIGLMLSTPLVAWADDAAQPKPTLDPVRRAYVLMALVGLLLIGGMLILLVVTLGRQTRRWAQKRHPPTTVSDDQWYKKPLVPRPEEPGPQHDA